jgi:hypothetical protein
MRLRSLNRTGFGAAGLAALATAILLAPAAGQAGGPSAALVWSPSTSGSFDYGTVAVGQSASQRFTLSSSQGKFGGLAVSPSGLTAAGAGWSKQTINNVHGGSFQAVSCASSSFCLAYNFSGTSVTWNGNSWSTPTTVAGGTAGGTSSYSTLDSVACPSASFCAAAVGISNGSGAHVATWNGSSWSALSSRFSFGSLRVSCTSGTFCMAAGIAVGKLDSATWNGSSWTSAASVAESSVDSLGAVSCASPSFCIVGDILGRALAWNGRTWSAPTKITSSGQLTGVSCVSPSFCMAVDNSGHAMRWNGKSWSSQTVFNQGGGGFYVSCSSSSFCLALTSDGEAATWNGHLWSKHEQTGITTPSAGARPLSQISSLSCVSASFCLANLDTGSFTSGEVAFYRGSTHAPTTPKTAPTTTSRAVHTLAVSFESYLVQMARDRAKLKSVLTSVATCSISPGAAAVQVAAVSAGRQRLLNAVNGFAAPTLQAAQIKAALRQSLIYSAAADRAYHDWLAQQGAHCPAAHTPVLGQAQQQDKLATAAKERFVAVFNPLARRLHLRTWSANMI